MRTTALLVAWVAAVTVVSAQTEAGPVPSRDSSVTVMDGIRFEAKAFVVDSASRTATATLSLTNLTERPRELKINVYGTQLVDSERNAHYFSTITLGRVLMRFEDRQNYLHYLLQPDAATTLTVTAENMPNGTAAIQLVKIVFEDRATEGRFVDAYVAAPATP